MCARRSSNHHHVQGVMGSLFSSSDQQTPSVNTIIPSILSTPPRGTSAPHPSPIPTSCIITIDDVGKLELGQYKCKITQLEKVRDEKEKEKGRTLTAAECTEVQKLVDATEKAGRYQARPITVTNSSGAEEEADLSRLPQSYQRIKNILWIESQPVYKAALEEWTREEAIHAGRIERNQKRSDGLNNEIYNIIGFFSVFQGVLLTATSQSNYLHCQNVALVVALSVFASVCCLLGILRKFSRIHVLEETICSELIHLKEAKARIYALKRTGQAFRFYDFLEDKPSSSQSNPTGRGLVCLVIGLFSVLFIMAHPLILCRPGPSR